MQEALRRLHQAYQRRQNAEMQWDAAASRGMDDITDTRMWGEVKASRRAVEVALEEFIRASAGVAL